MKESYKYLVKNVGLLTISNFATKILCFFLVPLYTNILTTEEYGTYDLINTTVGLAVPILTLNICDSVMRFSIDKNEDKTSVLSVGIKFFLISCLAVSAFLLVNDYFGIITIFANYSIYFLMMYITQALFGIINNFVRGIGKIAELAVSGVLSSFVTILCNIIFLIPMHLGIKGYFFATIIGGIVPVIYLSVKIKIWKYIVLRNIEKETVQRMKKYSIPLIANAVGWWINTVSDRYVVIAFCGLAVNGVYSAASKIPSILNIFQTIFSQAWTLSAVKDYDKKDQNGFFSKMYSMYNALMVVVCSALIVVDKVLAKILYAKDFYEAWKYAPFLMIAIVFGALVGYLGGIFSAVKESEIFAQSTVVGAVVNIILNLILVPFIGALGAAIATAVSYIIVWIFRLYHTKRFMDIKINILRNVISYIILIVQAIMILIIDNAILMYGIEIILFCIVLILYIKEEKMLLKNILKR